MSIPRRLDVQRERAARNQSLFREVNERIEDTSHSTTFPSFIREYADESCDETTPLALDEYEQATPRYVVVAKLGAGAQVAARLDPRTRKVG